MGNNVLVGAISSFFLWAVVAVSIQNVVLVRGFGISRLLSLVEDARATATFGLQLTLVTTIAGLANHFAQHYLLPEAADLTLFYPLVRVACTALAFAAVFVISIKFYPVTFIKEATTVLPMASFNCVVIGALQNSTLLQLTMLQTVGYCLGSSVGYIAAVSLVSEGGRKLHSPSMPKAFRGLPAVLLYLAGLVLALYGLTGIYAQ